MFNFQRFLAGLVGLAVIMLVNHFAFHQEPIPNIQIVLSSAVLGAVCLLSALSQRRRGRMKDGWHYLTPGTMEWFTFILCAGLSMLFFWIYYFVGTARPDPVSQMKALKLLAIVFSLGTAVVGFAAFGISTRWNDELIERHVPFRAQSTILLRNIALVYHEAWSDCLVIADAAGNRMRISPYQNGAEALVQKILGLKEEEAAPSS